MGKNLKKGSIVLVILVIAVVILAVSVVGMGVYIFTSDKFISDDFVSGNIDARKYHITNDLNENELIHYSKEVLAHEYVLGYFGDTNGVIKTRIVTNMQGNVIVDATLDGKSILYKEFSSSLFDKKVDEVIMVDFNSGIQNTIVYFLLEDGSVEYINFAELLLNEDISAKKKVKGLSNIVRIERLNAGPVNGGGGYQTGVAIDINGKWTILSEHANSVFDNNSYNETLQKLVNKYKK